MPAPTTAAVSTSLLNIAPARSSPAGVAAAGSPRVAAAPRAIVRAAEIRVAHHRIGLVDQLRALRIAPEIGMPAHLAHERAVRLLDHLLGGAGVHLKDLVVVDLGPESHRRATIVARAPRGPSARGAADR